MKGRIYASPDAWLVELGGQVEALIERMTALESAMPTSVYMAEGEDLDGAIKSGFYRLAGTHPHMPSANAAWSNMLVVRGGDIGNTVMQLICSYKDATIYVRSGDPLASGGSWTDWRVL